MKRKICIITLLFACCFAYGQEEYLQQANACFDKGDYDCAVRNYNAYGKISTVDVSDQIKKSEECLRLRNLADDYFSDKEYAKAGEKYQQILEKNPKDTYVKKQYDLCLTQSFPQDIGGIVIDSVRWATRNVGAKGQFASSPEEYGDYYNFDEAKDACPKGWRVPTNNELRSLANNNNSKWTIINGVNGSTFGIGNNRIFLPAAGYRNFVNGTLVNQGMLGYYWSSISNGTVAYNLGFNSSSWGAGELNNRAAKLSVRCVAE